MDSNTTHGPSLRPAFATLAHMDEARITVGNVLHLVPDSDPILSNPIEEFDFKNPPVDPMELTMDLIATMEKENGIGLSANQCGLPYRVFVIYNRPMMACFNPSIVYTSQETVSMDEGCLSFPGLIVRVKRPKHIRVRFQTPDGNMVTKPFDGMTARVFQHEFDHMEGVNFLDRANRIHRDRALNKFRILRRRLK